MIMEDATSVTTEQESADSGKDTSNNEPLSSDACPRITAVNEKTVISKPDPSATDKTMGSCPDIPFKIEPDSKEEECTLMEYRSQGGDGKGSPSDADSEDSSTSSDSSSDSEDNDAADTKINKVLSHVRDVSPEEIKRVKMNRFGFEDIRTKGELLPEELPPLEELTITVDEKVDMMYVGKITSVVGVLVIIQSSSEIPPLNDDTILFLEGHKVLGQVFEIFGPVKTPWYSVRFNDPENIKTKEITVGLSVYCAPKEECFTKYVFVDSLKQMKGSDASWEDNNEPPAKYVEFSDDEAERQAKAKKKNKRQNQEIENGGENMEKRNKNDYNQRERQSHYERPNRGHHDGGNQRFSRQRGRGNPFQGQNPPPMRPRFASSGQNNKQDARWNSNNRFNGPRWQGVIQNRGNNSSDRNEPEFTAERIPNFGGPPRFSSGPHFNGNMPRSQMQPQRQCFGNRMMHSGPDNANNWNQFNQNVFTNNNQGPRFTPSSAPLPQQNMSTFPYPERHPTPPPPPAPTPSSSSQFTPIQTQSNVFTPAPSPNCFPQAQAHTVQSGFQQNMTNMPQNMTNMPPNMTNMPQSMTNMPPNMTNMPQNMTNMPPNMTNMPQNITSMPPNMMNMVRNQGPLNPTVSVQPQPNAMGNQLCPVPANMVPPNATVYIPVSQMTGPQSSPGVGQNFVAPPNTQMIGPFSNSSSVSPQLQQNNQPLSMSTIASGQFNPCVPPPQISSSQNGNPCIPPSQISSSLNSVSTSSVPSQGGNYINSGSMYHNGGEQTKDSSNSFQSAITPINYQLQSNMTDRFDPQMKPYRQSKSRSEMTPGIQQTGQQQSFINESVGVAGNQQAGLPQKQTPEPASQTLPFQDAKFLHNMISAGMRQGSSPQIVDRRLMQND